MPKLGRRSFLTGTATAAAGVAASTAVQSASPGVAQAAAAGRGKGGAEAAGSLADIKHIIVFMQENRSFDHYFGTMRGVRGFADRSVIQLPGGRSVFEQPTTTAGQSQYPWPLADNPAANGAAGEVLGQCSGSTDHSWPTQHQAWDNGKMDAWIPAKGIHTMGYLTRQDIPFHHALADAYTICDAYHCSVLSATGPNRTYLFSGFIDPDGTAGGPAYNGGDESGLSWTTYAEELLRAGISWKVYQSYDNYGDNGLEYFNQFGPYSSNQYGPYSTMPPGNPLYPGVAEVPGSAAQAGSIDQLISAGIRADLAAGAFPQVSWIVPNQAFSEHPSAPPNDGAHFIHEVLRALAEYPDVLNSTAIFLDYDENDGLFDHVPPPVPEAGTPLEFIPAGAPGIAGTSGVAGTPIGLGFRVPMIVMSPWTRGGYVSSELSDHTSVLQFLEKWSAAIGKPATCENISAWRRQVCSDLTGLFDFRNPVWGLPVLPDTSAVIGLGYCNTLPEPVPETDAPPPQEPGTRPARPLPYQPNANLTGLSTGAAGAVTASITLANEGPRATSATHFSVYANSGNPHGPWPYTVTAAGCSGGRAARVVTVDIGAGLGNGVYDLTVIGPNRFLRTFTGDVSTAGAQASATVSYLDGQGGEQAGLILKLVNESRSPATFTVVSNYYRVGQRSRTVGGGSSWEQDVTAAVAAEGWYDFTVTVSTDPAWSRRFVGHLETGEVSVTG
jgi:phospholipase C